MYTTRPSTSARSGGTRASDSDGPREGATGNPSVVCPLTIQCRLKAFGSRQHGRPDVAGLAHRRSIAELRRGLLDRGDDHLASVAAALDLLALEACQGAGRDQRPRPGAEVLRREALAHHFFDVVVDVPPADVHDRAVFGDILEEVFPGHLLQLADDPRHAAVPQLVDLLLAGLAAVVEPHRVTVDACVPVLQRGDAEAAVLLRVGLAARPHEAGGEDAQDARHHLLAGQPWQPHVAIDGLAHARQRAAERHQPVVLLLLPDPDGALAVAVLPAALLVAPDGLQLRARVAVDGNVGPCRRNPQGAQARHFPDGSPGESEAASRRADAPVSGPLQQLDVGHPCCNATAPARRMLGGSPAPRLAVQDLAAWDLLWRGALFPATKRPWRHPRSRPAHPAMADSVASSSASGRLIFRTDSW